MIVDANDIVGIPEFSTFTVDELQAKLDALEDLIRSYTNNNFQNIHIRFLAQTNESTLTNVGSSPSAIQFLKVGDTVQISASDVNDCLCVVESVDEQSESITVDKTLFSKDSNLVTKVDYPLTVVQGVINLLKWQVTMGDKVGIQSETISRHSVTYFNADAQNQVMGFPVSLLGFLTPYKKARF